VILDLVKRSGAKHRPVHNLTTLDPPELIRFGRKYHPDTIVQRPKRAMLTMLAESNKGPPTRIVRWCCSEYKERHGNDGIKILGVRAAESPRRRINWKVFSPIAIPEHGSLTRFCTGPMQTYGNTSARMKSRIARFMTKAFPGWVV